jgi:hypothetical protein
VTSTFEGLDWVEILAPVVRPFEMLDETVEFSVHSGAEGRRSAFDSTTGFAERDLQNA